MDVRPPLNGLPHRVPLRLPFEGAFLQGSLQGSSWIASRRTLNFWALSIRSILESLNLFGPGC